MMRIILLSFLLISCSSLNKTSLTNGSSLAIHLDEGLPRQIVTMQLHGLVNEASKEEQAVFTVISRVFEQGPEGMTEEDYKQKLFLLNASITFSASYRSYDISIISPPQHMQETLDLALRTLRHPRLDKASVDLALNNSKANLQSAFSSMRTGLMYHTFKDYFQNDPLAFNGTTSPKDISKLTASKVIDLYKRLFTLQHMRVYSVGPIAKLEMTDLLNAAIAKYNVPAFSPFAFSKTMKQPKAKVQVIHRPKVSDHQVLFLFHHSFHLDGRESVVAQTMFDYFGGGLTGQLGMILREQRGLTYHATSNYGRFLPSWYIYSFAGTKQLEPLLRGVIEVKELSAAAQLQESELNNIKSTLITDYKTAYELPMDNLGLEAYADLFGLNITYLRKFPQEVLSVSTKEVMEYKQKLLSDKEYSLYLMGDKNVILPILKKIGYQNIEIIDETNI